MLDIEERFIDELIPYPNNPRDNDKAVRAVADSIRAFGFRQPIVVDRDGVIVAGHTRYKAAKLLGLRKVPVTVMDAPPDEVQAYRLADNKSADKATWDMDKLKIELKGIELDMSPWFGSQDLSFATHDGAEPLKDSAEYLEWLAKFDEPKTTDDCYTPANVYEAVAEWVANEYGLDRSTFCRPFYPGGDYQSEDYTGRVVVDNPPFSIMAEIIRFYTAQDVPFFLFASSLTLFSARGLEVCYMPVGVTVTYDNGAAVNTSFVTNIDSTYRVRTAPSLYEAVKAANDANLAETKADLPKYEYPDEIITSAIVARWCKYGVDFKVKPEDCVSISALDMQKEKGVGIFGGGFLLSERAAAERAAAERAAAERAAAERAAAERWRLSDRERALSMSLG